MYLFAMSSLFLERCSYHPIFGLRYHTGSKSYKETNNIAKTVEHLRANPDQREKAEKIVTQISNRSWFVRGMYWFFNVNNYCSHYYSLQSYYSNELYEKGRFLVDEDNNSRIRTNAFNIAASHPIVTNLFSASNPQSGYWLKQIGKFGKLIERICIKAFFTDFRYKDQVIFPVVAASPVEKKEQDTKQSSSATSAIVRRDAPNPANKDNLHEVPVAYITVTASMTESLNVLDLKIALGEQLTLGALKKAYLSAALKTHPDKTQQDSSDAFTRVGKAYETLLEKLMPTENQDQNANLALWIKREFEMLESKRKELRVCVSRYMQKSDEYIEELRAENKEAKESNELLKNHIEFISQYCEESRQSRVREEESMQQLQESLEELRKIKKESEPSWDWARRYIAEQDIKLPTESIEAAATQRPENNVLPPAAETGTESETKQEKPTVLRPRTPISSNGINVKLSEFSSLWERNAEPNAKTIAEEYRADSQSTNVLA